MRTYIVGLLSIFAFTQVYGQLPFEHIDPARLGRQFTPTHEPREGTVDRLPVQQQIEPTKPKSQVTFILKKIHIVGSKRIKPDNLRFIYQDKLGKKISLSELQEIANMITMQYRERGYLISQAILPAQSITDGVVTIDVIEGYIHNVYMQGSIPTRTKGLIQHYADHIIHDRPTSKSVLERNVLLIDDIPGLTVKTILKPSASAVGASDMILDIESDYFDGFFNFDNRLSRRYGPQQITAQAAVNHLIYGSRTAVTGKVSVEVDRMKILNLIHSQYFGDNGLKMTVLGQYVETNPRLSVDGFPTLSNRGNSSLFNINLSYPLQRSRQKTWTIEGELDVQQMFSRTKMSGTVIRITEDRIRSIRLGTSFEMLDNFWGSNLLSFEVSQGIDMLNASGRTNASRANGRIDYTKLNAEASRLQMLPKDFSVLLIVQGQFAFNELLSQEEFGIGGAHIGRGYDSSEIVGDDGIASKLELRYNLKTGSTIFHHIQLYGFVDAGIVWNKSVIGQRMQEELVSTGMGARANIRKNLTANIEVAKPINRIVAANRNRDPRVFFGVTAFI